MTAEEFGREVLRDVLHGKRGMTYTGTLGWAAKWSPMYPVWFVVSFGFTFVFRFSYFLLFCFACGAVSGVRV